MITCGIAQPKQHVITMAIIIRQSWLRSQVSMVVIRIKSTLPYLYLIIGISIRFANVGIKCVGPASRCSSQITLHFSSLNCVILAQNNYRYTPPPPPPPHTATPHSVACQIPPPPPPHPHTGTPHTVSGLHLTCTPSFRAGGGELAESRV